MTRLPLFVICALFFASIQATALHSQGDIADQDADPAEQADLLPADALDIEEVVPTSEQPLLDAEVAPFPPARNQGPSAAPPSDRPPSRLPPQPREPQPARPSDSGSASLPPRTDTSAGQCTSPPGLSLSKTVVTMDEHLNWTARGFEPDSMLYVSTNPPISGNVGDLQRIIVGSQCQAMGSIVPVAGDSGAYVLRVSGKAYRTQAPLDLVAQFSINFPGGSASGASSRPGIVLAPDDVRIELAGASAARVLWSDNSTNETGFRVEYPGGTQTVASNATSAMITGLGPGRTYCVRVSAFNDTAVSSPAQQCVSTPAATSIRSH